MNQTNVESWSPRFLEAVDFSDSGSNFKKDFAHMCRHYGREYIDYLKVSYSAKDNLSDDDFCKLNGNVPPSFINKIKNVSTNN